MPPLLALEDVTVGYTADRPLVRNLCSAWDGGAHCRGRREWEWKEHPLADARRGAPPVGWARPLGGR